MFARLRKQKIPVFELSVLASDIFSGTTPKAGGDAYTDDPVEGVPFVRSGEITNDGLVEDESAILLKKEIHEGLMRRSQLQNDDLLIAIVGATIGAVGIYDRNKPANINQAIAAIRLNQDRVLPEFARWFLLTNIGQSILDFLKRPVARANINLEEVGEIILPVPPLDVQQALVKDMEAARAARKQKLAEADALLAGVDDFVLQQLDLTVPEKEKRLTFAVRLGQCKGGRADALYNAPHFSKVLRALKNCPHKKVLLGTLSPEIAGGATPARGDADLYADEGIKFLRILNVAPFEVVLNNLKYIQESVNDGELARSKLAANDVLMTITGRVGTAAVVLEETLPANINQHIVRLRIQGNDCLPEYLAAWLNSSIGNALSNRGVTGGTRIALDYETIRNLLIPLPPLTIQQAITAEVTRRREQAHRLREQASTGWQSAKARFEAQLLGDA